MWNYGVLEDGQGDNDDYCTAIQEAINGGTAWKLQGSAGRAMMEAINGGAALLGKQPAFDYYGNRIPSRDEVKAGTRGSYEFVVAANGKAFADRLAGL
jgi:hypothetical protein